MLKYLHIENIAVIERTDIEFSKGFNVLTGETGAGKSIIIDSINAVLGERTSRDLIRTGCDEALVSALFGNFPKEIEKIFNENDIELDSDGNILIERRLSLSGKGLIKLNSKPITAGALKEISSLLINIHGQHDNQSLLNPEKHCGFIDAIADNSTIIDEYYAEFRKLNSIRKELVTLQMDEDEKARKIELLKFQINEIESANIKAGEYNELKAKLKTAQSLETRQIAFNSVLQSLSGDEENDGILTLLKNCKNKLSKINDEKIDALVFKLDEMLSSAEDISSDLSDELYKLATDDFDPNIINQRLDLLQKLMLKYGNTEEKILDYFEKANDNLQNIVFSEKREEELSNELESSKLRLVSLGETLTKSRTDAARKFETQVCDVLKYLNMPHVKFSVSITSGKYTKNGCDIVEFLISPNMGEDLKPLHKIASGGELSRVMLAIKSVLLDKDFVDTMVFDEIDAGISGYAADRVGNRLKKVSANRQVLCITHLAQIAARADNHLLIKKYETDSKTFTEVTSLSNEDRINELARIMSGSEITNNLYNSAKELLNRSQIDENL